MPISGTETGIGGKNQREIKEMNKKKETAQYGAENTEKSSKRINLLSFSDKEQYMIKILRNEFSIEQNLAEDIAKRFAKEFSKKIVLEVTEDHRSALIFECNLTPEEIKRRETEVKELLPMTEFGLYNRILIPRVGIRGKKENFWIYFAFL